MCKLTVHFVQSHPCTEAEV